MKRVAAARLRRAQGRVAAGRPYAEKLAEVLQRVGAHAGQIDHPLLVVREPKCAAVVVIGSDRGLCGSYNSGLIRHAQGFIAELDRPVKLVTVNRKTTEFFRRRPQYEVLKSFVGLSDQSSAIEISVLSGYLRDIYEAEQVDEVYVCYTQFVSAVVQRPKTARFLPFSRNGSEDEGADASRSEYIFEPNAADLLRAIIPAYVDTEVYHLVMESAASEYGARMMAMTNATENATEMIRDLTLTFNKARQAGITTELLEVVAGADALTEG